MFKTKKYTTKEFVQELDINYKYWANHKETRERYLDYLQDFINFTIEKQGRQNFYIVHEIYQKYKKPDFRKLSKLRDEVRKCFKEVWQVNAPETCSRVAAKMIKQKMVSSASQKSVERTVREVRNDKFSSYTGELAHELSCDWIVYVDNRLVAVPEDIEAMEKYYNLK